MAMDWLPQTAFGVLIRRSAVLLLLLGALPAWAGAPTISGSPPTTASVGMPYEFKPTVTNPDGYSVTFFIVNRPSWARFDAATGRLSGTPTAGDVGTTSGVRIGLRYRFWGRWYRSVYLPRFDLKVVAPSKPPPSEEPVPPPPPPPPPPPNSAPVISGTPAPQVIAGQAYAFTPTASDANGDGLTFTIANRPPWAVFNAATGRLSGTPSAADIGHYANITIRVSDGAASAALAPFTIAVVSNATGTATLTWSPPTTRVDGSALTNLAGYRILWGTAQNVYSNEVRLTSAGLTRYVLDGLVPATYYFAIVAVDGNGLESPLSNVAQKTIAP